MDNSITYYYKIWLIKTKKQIWQRLPKLSRNFLKFAEMPTCEYIRLKVSLTDFSKPLNDTNRGKMIS